MSKNKCMDIPYIGNDYRSFISAVMRIAIPVAVQILISVGINMVDMIMMGSLGEIPLNAVLLGGQLFLIFTLILYGITGGANVLIAQYWGKQDTLSIKGVLGYTFKIMMGVAAIITIIAVRFPHAVMSVLTNNHQVVMMGNTYLKIVSISYIFFGITTVIGNSLRAIGVVNITMIASLVSIAASTILNWILVFGNLGFQPLGIKGSAISNVLARILECLILVVYLFIYERKLQFKIEDIFLSSKRLRASYISNTLPVVGNELTWVLGATLITMIAGHMAIGFTTAFNIFNVVSQISCSLAQGVACAASVIVGNMIGRGLYDDMGPAIKKLQRLGLAVGLIACFFIIFLIPWMPKLTNINEETYKSLTQIMLMGSIIEILRSVSFVNNVGILRGGGDAHFVFFNDVFYLWAFCIPVGYLCSKQEGIPTVLVFLIMRCDDMIKAVVSNYRIKRSNWIHNATV